MGFPKEFFDDLVEMLEKDRSSDQDVVPGTENRASSGIQTFGADMSKFRLPALEDSEKKELRKEIDDLHQQICHVIVRSNEAGIDLALDAFGHQPYALQTPP